MKAVLTIAIFFLLNISSYCQTIEQQFQKAIDSVYNANPDVIGYIVAVEAPDRNISWTGATGYSGKDSLHRLDPYQPALIASNIKTYVAATILRLVEEHKIDIQQPIKELLTGKTGKLFESDGYILDSIKVVHLLSHKSGIGNYGNNEYYKFVSENPEYRWTRSEQLERTITVSDPLCKPGMSYHYSDVNYLLLTEIIEQLTDQPFYTAMRELLMYKELGLDDTWQITLENEPSNCKPMVHQYFSSSDWDSYNIDPSWDLYGGGGIACTMEDMAKFISNLHNQMIVKDPEVLDLIFTRVETVDSTGNNYYLGIQEYIVEGTKGFGHGGAWGTFNIYFPEINTTIALCPLEAEKRKLNGDVISKILGLLTTEE